MPRRRIYILNYQDYLHAGDPPPPSRIRPALRFLALVAALIGNGILLAWLIGALVPADNLHTAITVAIGYALIILFSIALAKRLNHP